ncbi:MAG: PBP1A family penicillin-binding protein [Kofleriaceae bacterium]
MAKAPRRRPPRPRRLRAFSLLRLALLLLVYGAAAGAATIYLAVRTVNAELPKDLTALLDYQPNRRSVVVSTDGEEVGTFSIENRRIVPLERIPPHVTAAFVAAEDGRFYKHPGFDLVGIARAAWTNFRSEGIRQGGSTITQQILKQTLLAGDESFDPTGLAPEDIAVERRRQKYQRKIKEVILAVRLERELSKAQILSIYLNHVYLGHGAYGVAAAGAAYFGKDVENLTIAEASMLAGLIASPSRYAPHRNMKLARERQRYVLGRMLADGYISNTELQSALAEPIALVSSSDLNHLASPYFVEHLRQLAQTRYGTSELFRGGLRFYATLDTRAQQAAEDALHHGLELLDRRLGFRGPLGQVPAEERAAWRGGLAHPLRGASDDVSTQTDQLIERTAYGAMVTELGRGGAVLVDLGPAQLPLVEADAKLVRAWRDQAAPGRALAVGDLLPVRLTAEGQAVELAQRPEIQGALLAMELHTGRVIAMVGGYDWADSQFNRATQARRQVGSSIKPFIYSAALAAGKTPVERMVDAPFGVPTATGTWVPANYDNRYHGAVTLSTALALSLNTISVQLVVDVGLDRVIELLRGFGVSSPIPRHISIALGTPDLTLLELVTAYCGLLSGGARVTAKFFDHVADTAGHVVEDLRVPEPARQILPPAVAYVITAMMKGVVERGTAKGAQALGRPVAGKTGTSANYRDVWFLGATADLLVGVWIGRDDSKPIGDKITGGGVAVPIWLDFMQKAHPETPVRDFPMPEGVTLARIEPWSGEPSGPSPSARWIPFVRGTLPARFAAPAPRSFEDTLPAPPLPPGVR